MVLQVANAVPESASDVPPVSSARSPRNRERDGAGAGVGLPVEVVPRGVSLGGLLC